MKAAEPTLTPWQERQLPFGRGVDELPVLLERLLGTAARLSDLTSHEPLERLSLRRQGSWSVLEHIGHLTHLQDRFDERVDDFEAQRPCLCSIDLKDQDSILSGYTARALGDVLEEFRLKRAYFVERVQALDPGALRHSAQHPCRGQRMTLVDMVLYLAEHDDHHLVVIRRLLQGGAMPVQGHHH
jgi:hypothetical protein